MPCLQPGKQQPGVFTANQPPQSQQGGLKGLQPLIKGYFLPQANGKGCEGGFVPGCQTQRQQHSLTRVTEEPRKAQLSLLRDQGMPQAGQSSLLWQTPQQSSSVQGSASAAPRNHSPTLCLSFPAGKAGIKHHNPPRLLGRRPLSNCEAAGEYFLNKAAEFLPCAQMLW